MTVTDETVDLIPDASEQPTETKRGRKKKSVDFTKFTALHENLAEYINTHSGLDPITANQVKAVLLLRTAFSNTPEQVSLREQHKAERAAEKAKYAGMTDDQIKAEKAAEKIEKNAEKLRKRVEEAYAKASRIREGTEASGEDLAAVVEAEQSGEEAAPSRRFGRRK